MPRRSLVPLLMLLGVLGCSDHDAFQSPSPTIRVETIPASALPVTLDPTRTYFFDSPQAAPEVLLRGMWSRGIRPRRAWNPLPNPLLVCPAVMPGPRFTVELDRHDPRILDEGFFPGTNGLTCATHYVRYSVIGEAAPVP